MTTVYFKSSMSKPGSMSQTISNLHQKWWKRILEKVNKAIVFIDSAASESLNWLNCDGKQGLSALFHSGAVNVKELSSFESASPSDKKAVFLITSPLSGLTIDLIRSIVQASSFEYCCLITPYAANVHHFAKSTKSYVSGNEDEAFYYIEDCLLQWMGNMSYTVEILHIPYGLVPFTSSFFVIPSLKTLYPVSFSRKNQAFDCSENFQDNKVLPKDLEFQDLGEENQTKIKMLCGFLDSILEGSNICDDIHTIGLFSELVAKEFNNLNSVKIRRKNCKNKASLLLIDRNLDYSTAVSSNTDCLLDKIIRILPPLSDELECDVAVDISSLNESKSARYNGCSIPGTIAQISTETCQSVLLSCSQHREKQTVRDINQYLLEALREESIEIDKNLLKIKDPAEKLKSMVQLFSTNNEAIFRHRGLLQLALAIVQTLKNDNYLKMDKMVGVEKLLLQAITDQESFMLELVHVIRIRKEKNINIEDIFLLLIYLLQDSSEVLNDLLLRDKLLNALSKAIVEDKEKLSTFISSKVGSTDRDCYDFVNDVFTKITNLKNVYKRMKNYNYVIDKSSDLKPPSHKPLIKRIMEDIFLEKKQELTDIEHHSSGLGKMIKSGFGLFVNVSKARPDDNPNLFVFVIGGITASECRQINEVVASSNKGINVIVGSTALIKPITILQHIFES